MVSIRVCEICGEGADVYCGADAAFLCFKCDCRVHETNFLFMRHIRELVCGGCKEMTGEFVSGIGFDNGGCLLSICKLCKVESSCCSSSCISSTISKRMHQARSKKPVVKRRKKRCFEGWVRGLMVKWCRKMGVIADDADVITSVGYRMFRETTGGVRTWESIVASFWVSLRLRRMASCERLRKLAEISRVEEKFILAGERKIAAMIKDQKILDRGGGDVEEGWGESC